MDIDWAAALGNLMGRRASAPPQDYTDQLQQYMTHQPERPNPAAPYVEMGGKIASHLAERFAAPFTAPLRAMRGEFEPASQEGVGEAMGLASQLMGQGTFAAPRGAAGVFGGKLTKTNHYPGGPEIITVHGPEGERLAEINAHFDGPDTLRVNQFKSEGGPHSLGVEGIRGVMDQLRQLYPDVKNIEGFRGTGARSEVGGKDVSARLAPPAPQGIPAYHGSPHDFDKFDISKIGTGEGRQAYGHGLYFAENEGVAKQYQKDLAAKINTRPVALADDGPFAGVQGLEPDPSRPGKMYQVAIKADPEHFLDWDKPLSEQSPKVREAFAKVLQPDVKARSIGRNEALGEDLHDVTIGQSGGGRGSIGMFPTSKLSEVMADPYKFDPRSGELIYQEAARKVAAAEQAKNPGFTVRNPHDASAALREAGIPGIKYFDQGSRVNPVKAKAELDEAKSALAMVEKQPAGPGRDQRLAQLRDWHDAAAKQHAYAQNPTRNYVVFDDKLIDILKKYGIAGIGALPAMGAYHFQHTQDQ